MTPPPESSRPGVSWPPPWELQTMLADPLAVDVSLCWRRGALKDTGHGGEQERAVFRAELSCLVEKNHTIYTNLISGPEYITQRKEDFGFICPLKHLKMVLYWQCCIFDSKYAHTKIKKQTFQLQSRQEVWILTHGKRLIMSAKTIY